MTTPIPAPSFHLKAIASGRSFRLSDYLGHPVLLLFVDYNTARATREIVIGVRRHYPDFARLPIAIVVDLQVVPKLLRGTAERIMETAYQGAASEVPAGYDPQDHLILLPDWTGETIRTYRIGNLKKQPQLVMVAPDGTIFSTYQGPDPLPKALELIEHLVSQ